MIRIMFVYSCVLVRCASTLVYVIRSVCTVAQIAVEHEDVLHSEVSRFVQLVFHTLNLVIPFQHIRKFQLATISNHRLINS